MAGTCFFIQAECLQRAAFINDYLFIKFNIRRSEIVCSNIYYVKMNKILGDIEDEMQRIYGFSTFKSSYQRDGILAVLQGDHDVFINLPPNTGKSLCYQIPAIMTHHKSAIVFVRNNNTAQEHVKLFIGKNINVCYIDSSLQKNKIQERVRQLKHGQPVASLIYVPISLCNKSWIKDLITTLGSRDSISFFVIDEAIHLSHNSTSFNKFSLGIVPLRNMFASVPLIALTSCASQQIKSDILNTLSMKNPREIISSNWLLPNIYIRVKFKDIIPNPYHDLKEMINNYKSNSHGKFCGIVYCRTKEETIIVARELSRLHISTVPYNASLSILDRKRNKSLWKVGKATMIAVTHGSAVGLDKPNVKCIIHWSVPVDIGEYYHEIGKADRNNVKAMCCVYFSLYDWIYVKKIAVGMLPSLHDSSETMIQFCLAEECRHIIYSKYFESMAPACGTSCDWCTEKDDMLRSLEAFNDILTRHRLLSLNPSKNIANTLNAGVYDVQNTKTYIKNAKPNLRFYWYRKLATVLIENYEVAHCSNKEITKEGLCRLARNLEYSQLLVSDKRGTYIFAITSMVDTIVKNTMKNSLSNYILNYDCLIGRSEGYIERETDHLLSIVMNKTEPKDPEEASENVR